MPGAQVWEGAQQLLLGVGEGAFSVELCPEAGGEPRTQAWVYALKHDSGGHKRSSQKTSQVVGWGKGGDLS